MPLENLINAARIVNSELRSANLASEKIEETLANLERFRSEPEQGIDGPRFEQLPDVNVDFPQEITFGPLSGGLPQTPLQIPRATNAVTVNDRPNRRIPEAPAPPARTFPIGQFQNVQPFARGTSADPVNVQLPPRFLGETELQSRELQLQTQLITQVTASLSDLTRVISESGILEDIIVRNA